MPVAQIEVGSSSSNSRDVCPHGARRKGRCRSPRCTVGPSTAVCGVAPTTLLDPASSSLVLCTETALYRLSTAQLAGASVQEPVRFAGKEELSGPKDGVGTEARFSRAHRMTVDGEGNTWVLDVHRAAARQATRLARLAADGSVTTILADVSGAGIPKRSRSETYTSPAILRNGCLALLPLGQQSVLLLQLGVSPPWPGASPSHSHGGTLAADLGALLDRQPDGSADVELEVGGQVFAAHRGVLAARSPYFRQRLDPGAGFSDGRGARLSLLETDPEAFGVALRFVYTDSMGLVPPELLQAVGELADRLLLPGLCAQVGSQLLNGVCADDEVGLLLWAEQRSGSFGALLSGLKGYFVRHLEPGRERVLPVEHVMRLMRESPDLAVQLLYLRR